MTLRNLGWRPDPPHRRPAAGERMKFTVVKRYRLKGNAGAERARRRV